MELIKGNDRAIELPSQLNGTGEGTVGHQDISDSMILQMTDGKFPHFPGTNHHRSLILQVIEDFSCQLDSGRTHGDCPCRNLGLATHSLGNRKGFVKTAMQNFSQSSARRSSGVCIFDLSENLRLSHNERVKASGNSEEVADRFFPNMAVEMILKQRPSNPLLLGKEGADSLIGSHQVRRTHNDFDSVTGGNNRPFPHDFGINQPTQRGFQCAIVEREPFTHFDRCAPVIQPQNQEVWARISQIALHDAPEGNGH
jgi:hypothetical protein